jgi:hypothetical protein
MDGIAPRGTVATLPNSCFNDCNVLLRRSAADSDSAVLAVAAEIGARRGFGAEWLNNSASQFIPAFKEPNWQPIFKSGNVEIVAADERSILAMKRRAGRGSRDRLDINFLIKRCGVTGVAEALDLYEEYFAEDPLPDRALPLLDEAIEALGPQSA